MIIIMTSRQGKFRRDLSSSRLAAKQASVIITIEAHGDIMNILEDKYINRWECTVFKLEMAEAATRFLYFLGRPGYKNAKRAVEV